MYSPCDANFGPFQDVSELLKQFRKTAMLSPDLESAVLRPEFRMNAYRYLVKATVTPFRPLLMRLFPLEVAYRKAIWARLIEDDDDDSDFFEGIYHAGYLLSLCANPSDVELIWTGHMLNQDIGELDPGNFVGAGLEQTLSYLDTSSHPDAPDIACFIRTNFEAFGGEAGMQRWRDRRREWLLEY
ncbi:hypothetical protein [Stenotrophomonas sp.]|uniref:hypothetical protein n=1 Tax=Stenotrophomonas sp. TaxID=69392 RepID=UPI0028A11538|nr:hypothetical protein [Stenotrophomonas sp.]